RGQREEFGECAVAALNPEDRAIFTMRQPPLATRLARMTRRVDLADDALSIQLTDELVSGNSNERIVAARKLQVSGAEAREQRAHERVAGGNRGSRHITKRQPLIFQPQGAHGVFKLRTKRGVNRGASKRCLRPGKPDKA